MSLIPFIFFYGEKKLRFSLKKFSSNLFSFTRNPLYENIGAFFWLCSFCGWNCLPFLCSQFRLSMYCVDHFYRFGHCGRCDRCVHVQCLVMKDVVMNRLDLVEPRHFAILMYRETYRACYYIAFYVSTGSYQRQIHKRIPKLQRLRHFGMLIQLLNC